MRMIRFRAAALLALLVTTPSLAIIDASSADESKRPARRQAAGRVNGAPRLQSAESLHGGSKRVAAKAPADTAASAARPDSAVARPATADSSKGSADSEKSPGKAGAGRDSTAKKAPAEKEPPREDALPRGPRFPVWPGISLAHPSAEHGRLAAAR